MIDPTACFRCRAGRRGLGCGLLLVTAAALFWATAAAQERPEARYDCSWITPAASQCPPADDALAGLSAAADLHEAASHFGPDEATWSKMLAAVTRARGEFGRERLSFRERVVAQNAALRIAVVVASYSAGAETDLTRRLLRESAGLIAWLALPADRLEYAETFGDLAQWFGPDAAPQELRVGDGRFVLHEAVHVSTRAFRMVRVGDRHFIFSQLVAIDDRWRPHVTTVIGDMEMRNEEEAAMPACIAEFDAAAARCGAPAGLRALDRLPISHVGGYVRVDESGRANCNQCHIGGQVLGQEIRELTAAEIAAELRLRQTRLLSELDGLLVPVRAAAAADPE